MLLVIWVSGITQAVLLTTSDLIRTRLDEGGEQAIDLQIVVDQVTELRREQMPAGGCIELVLDAPDQTRGADAGGEET
jgi:hypothetical protein